MLSTVDRFIFSGALVPKQIKRILKMRGLSAVVARDAESVQAMDEALDVVRAELLLELVVSCAAPLLVQFCCQIISPKTWMHSVIFL